jgi:hypothetical protein
VIGGGVGIVLGATAGGIIGARKHKVWRHIYFH